MDFKGMLNGVAFNGGTASNYDLELGSQQFIPGFEDQLVGAKAGEDRNVKVTFPANYPNAELAGKEAIFAVKIHKIQPGKPLSPQEQALKAKIGEELQNLHQVAVNRVGQLQAQVQAVEQNELAPAAQKVEKAHMFSGAAKLAGLVAAAGGSLYFTGGMSWLARTAIGAASAGVGYVGATLATRSQELDAVAGYMNKVTKREAIGQQAAKEIAAFQERAHMLQAGLANPAAALESLYTSKVTRAPGVAELASGAEAEATPTVKTR
jgi:hypothetical protein